MLDLETAQSTLRGLNRPIKEFDEENFAIERMDQKYLIPKSEILKYISIKDKIRSSSETQLWYPGYYEHAVQFEGLRPRRPLPREEDALQLQSKDGVEVVIKRPSMLFLLKIFDSDTVIKEMLRLAMPTPVYRRTTELQLSDLFRIYTVRVTSPPETASAKTEKRSHEIAEACIFHFAYGKGVPISFAKSWARTYYWIGRKSSEDVQFPLKHYNSELVGYYNLALSSDSMVLGFLALYKILEYFYSGVSEEDLHAKIREKITAPDFSHTKTRKLRELVKAIHGFERNTNELSSLKMVIAKYFDKKDLVQWISDYEKSNEPYFTVENEIFNTNYRIDVSDNTLIPNISNRIYDIRNAIVHNKESEVSRYIPYSGQEDVLQKEVHLLVYIAEQLIIKTGKDF